jgi:hypothetical protein
MAAASNIIANHRRRMFVRDRRRKDLTFRLIRERCNRRTLIAAHRENSVDWDLIGAVNGGWRRLAKTALGGGPEVMT